MVIIRAHRKSKISAEYSTKSSSEWWQWMHNKTNGYQDFQHVPSIEESHSHHLLGEVMIKSGQQVPNTWFGPTEAAAQVAQAIWEMDHDHDLIMHPEAELNERNLIIKVRLKKRLASSIEYRQLMKECVAQVEWHLPEVNLIIAEVFLRETYDSLVNLTINKEMSFVDYNDECQRPKKHWWQPRYKMESINEWLPKFSGIKQDLEPTSQATSTTGTEGQAQSSEKTTMSDNIKTSQDLEQNKNGEGILYGSSMLNGSVPSPTDTDNAHIPNIKNNT